MAEIIKGFGNYSIDKSGCIIKLSTGLRIRAHRTSKGFREVRLINSIGLKQFMQLHRLLAIQFIDNPNSYKFVRHIDGNKEHNWAANLVWSKF